MDGELDAARAEDVLKSCRNEGEMAGDWDVYHCIGDVLRSSDMAAHIGGLATAVGTRLAIEPYPLVSRPSSSRPARMLFRGASIAAAASAVGAVAFLVLPQWTAQREQVASAPPAVAVAPVVPTPNAAIPAVAPVSREYLAAHRQYAGGLNIRVNAESGK
jgi:sigma-E factor negative regulatory protein RseA